MMFYFALCVCVQKKSQKDGTHDNRKEQSTPIAADKDNITSTPEKTPGGFYSRKTGEKEIHQPLELITSCEIR